MSTAHRIETGSHVALLDVLSGVGLPVLPSSPDVYLSGPVGLHEKDWRSMMAQLNALDWEPRADDDGPAHG